MNNEWLNQSMLEQWETSALLAYRETLVHQLGSLTTFLSQVEHALGKRQIEQQPEQ